MPCLVPVRRVLNLANPVEFPPWECGLLLNVDYVRSAVADRDWEHRPVDHWSDDDETFTTHARRIAYLVEHGWDDPIEIEVGIPSMNYFPEWAITDGNHRLYAAFVRGDKKILATISGSLGYAAQRFGIKATMLEERQP